MATFKPAYLIHGDDHGRIGERRARLRVVAEAESGASGIEIFEGETATPELVAGALRAMTFAIGRRFLIVDGVERWKDRDVEQLIAPALAVIEPGTTIAFFAREDGRSTAPSQLHDAVRGAAGEVAVEALLKAHDLPRWLIGEAKRLGAELDGSAARSLVSHVGERQQRLLRELEKLVLELGRGARIGVAEVDAVAANSAERQAWGLIDALVAGDQQLAVRRLVELRAQGESLARLIPLAARRLRDLLGFAARLEAGEPPAQIKTSTKGSPWAIDRRLKEARSADAATLRAALVTLSDLELATRGGNELDDDTNALRAFQAMTA